MWNELVRLVTETSREKLFRLVTEFKVLLFSLGIFPLNVSNGFPSRDRRGKRAKQNGAILPKVAATERSRELHVQNTPFWCVLGTNGGKSWPED